MKTEAAAAGKTHDSSGSNQNEPVQTLVCLGAGVHDAIDLFGPMHDLDVSLLFNSDIKFCCRTDRSLWAGVMRLYEAWQNRLHTPAAAV